MLCIACRVFGVITSSNLFALGPNALALCVGQPFSHTTRFSENNSVVRRTILSCALQMFGYFLRVHVCVEVGIASHAQFVGLQFLATSRQAQNLLACVRSEEQERKLRQDRMAD